MRELSLKEVELVDGGNGGSGAYHPAAEEKSWLDRAVEYIVKGLVG